MEPDREREGPTVEDWDERLKILRKLATRAADDRDMADEICAEAALRMVRWRDRIRDFVPWAAAVVRRLTWAARRTRRLKSGEGPEALDQLPGAGEIGVQLRLLATETLSSLPERQARLLRLWRMGHSHRELAAELGCSTHQIGPRLARAHRAARQLRDGRKPNLAPGTPGSTELA